MKFTFTEVGPAIVGEYAQQLQNDFKFKASKLFANITTFVKIH